MTQGTPPKARGMGKAWVVIALVVLALVLVAGWLFWTDDEVPQVTALEPAQIAGARPAATL